MGNEVSTVLRVLRSLYDSGQYRYTKTCMVEETNCILKRKKVDLLKISRKF